MPNQLTASRSISAATAIVLSIMLTLFQPVQAAEETLLISPELQVHIDLIDSALQTDAYNKRCRGVSMAKTLNLVNRLYVTKYSLTANNFIKHYIHEDVKALKIARQVSFNKQLAKIGGCQEAKAQGWVSQLKSDFKNQYEQAELSTWYPE